jgi:hypothetical protein
VFVTLKDFQSATAIGTTGKYRLRLVVTGASPVSLAAFVEVQNGSSWDLLAASNTVDTSPDRITTPGVVGFSAGNDPTGVFAYDNFSAKGL